mmetsp:Transcript_25407/g.54196  ORF Transcript_25407/g.54196 Transcript_25407/m.54196 type:complete len:328 (+) Transcript_25407:59-1042(+)
MLQNTTVVSIGLICYDIRFFRAVCLFKSLRSRNNLKNFLGDGSLTGTIVFQRKLRGKLSGVITCGLHRLHTGGELGGNRFLKSTEDLSVQVQRKDGVNNLKRVLFEDHIVGEFLGFGNFEFGALDTEVSGFGSQLENFITSLGDVGSRERNQCSDGRSGGNKRNELGVKQFDGISFSGKEGVQQFLGDSKGLLGARVLSAVECFSDGVVTTFEVGNSLDSDKHHIDINSLGGKFLESGFGLLDHEGVVPSAKTTISGDNSQSDLLDFTLGKKRKINGFTTKTSDKPSENRLKSFGERTGGEDSVLGTTDLGGSDKLHGHGNFLCVLN